MNPNYASLISRLEKLIEENIGNEQFGVEELATLAGISRSHLHRKLRATTGKSASQFIRDYRLQKALVILKDGQLSVSEVAFRVGFSSPTYFSKSFADLYGHPPSQFHKVVVAGPDRDPGLQSGRKGIKPIKRKWLIVLVTLVILLPYTIFFIVQLSGKNKSYEAHNKSVAILPFQNLSDDPVNAYFSVGVGDAIARKLSGISDLRIVSKTLPVQKGGEEKSMVDIAQKLNTSYILDGSVQKFGEIIRVEVGLVNGETGHRIWAEHYDRKFEDIFQVQNEIAEKVALSLKTSLSPTERSDMNLGYSNNPQAYELYLKARYEFGTYSREGYRKAEDYSTQAIALDTNFALAYSLLGNISFAKGSMFGVELDAREALEQAIIPIRRALEVVPNLPEAHAMKGFYHLYYEWDFKKAEDEYKLGMERFNTESYAYYADYLNFVGRHKEALVVSRQLEYYEPYYPNTRMILSLYYNQMYDEAREFALTRLRTIRNYSTLDSYGFLLLNIGDYEEAIDVFKQIFELEGVRYRRIMGWLGAAFARSGQEDQARLLIKELEELRAQSTAGSPGFFIAVIYAALGEEENALEWISTAMVEREMEIPWLTTEPQFNALHERADFKGLVKQVGFPGY